MPTYSTAEPIPYDERGDYPGRDWPWWKDVARVATMGAYHPGDRDISKQNEDIAAINLRIKGEQAKKDADLEGELARMEKSLRDIGTPEDVINTVKREHIKVSQAQANEALNRYNAAKNTGATPRAGDLGRAETDKGIAEADAGISKRGLDKLYTDAEAATHTPKIVAQNKENNALDAQKKADEDRARATWTFEDEALNRGTAEAAGLPVELARTLAEIQKLAAQTNLNKARYDDSITTIKSKLFTPDEQKRILQNQELNKHSTLLGPGSSRRDALGNVEQNEVIYTIEPKTFSPYIPGQVVEQVAVRGRRAPIQAPPMSLGPSTASPAPVSPAPGGAVLTMTPAEFEAKQNARKYAPRTGQ